LPISSRQIDESIFLLPISSRQIDESISIADFFSIADLPRGKSHPNSICKLNNTNNRRQATQPIASTPPPPYYSPSSV
jgi:hypothetical protein